MVWACGLQEQKALVFASMQGSYAWELSEARKPQIMVREPRWSFLSCRRLIWMEVLEADDRIESSSSAEMESRWK